MHEIFPDLKSINSREYDEFYTFEDDKVLKTSYRLNLHKNDFVSKHDMERIISKLKSTNEFIDKIQSKLQSLIPEDATDLSVVGPVETDSSRFALRFSFVYKKSAYTVQVIRDEFVSHLSCYTVVNGIELKTTAHYPDSTASIETSFNQMFELISK